MARLLSFLSFRKAMVTEDWITLYVPLSPKEIPRDQLEHTIRSWLHPELGWVKGYLDLESAICSQQNWLRCERYPHAEALRIIVELQVPTWLIDIQEDEVRINIREGKGWIQFENIYVTAKCVPGHIEEHSLPGDLPCDGTIYEVIVLSHS